MVDLRISLPEHFLDEEIRNDYRVSSKIKEVWAVELDLMAQLDRVCRKHGLVYFAGAGTLLGAVRHHGFIPWDDDMDFYMLRDDYNKLLLLKDEFEKPYFLQNAYTDPGLMRTFSRLRNSDTTACTVWDQTFNINKGIFIDIFPLDGISESDLRNRIQFVKDVYYQSCFKPVRKNFEGLSQKRVMKHVFANMLIRMNPMRRLDQLGHFRKYEANLSRYSKPGTAYWGNRTLVFNCPKSRRPIEDWLDITELPFEFMSIPVPRNYDDILRQQYGNYMEFPKDKTAGKMHNELILSTNYSYDDPRRLEE